MFSGDIMTSQNVDFFMEPVFFINDSNFLSGTKEKVGTYELVQSQDEALTLIFEQNLPSEYMVWSDFFAQLINGLINNSAYKQSQEAIKVNVANTKKDRLKDNIRKRKAFLLRKKNGLIDNDVYDNFVKEVSDECIYMLNMVATQRYIFGYIQDSVLEEIFDIFKKGCLPCGVKKQMKKLVVFNPCILKGE